MEPPRGFWSTLWRLFYFLPFFIGLLLLGIIKGALLCPIVCLIMTIGNSAIILGLWPAHAFWTFYCIARAKQLGPVLKLVLSVAVSVLLVLWPLIGILGSILTGAGYGFLMPIMATFDAIGEGKEDKFLHCIRDGIWSTIKGSCTVVRDLKDVSFHSYFSIMDDLRLQNARNGRPYEIRLTCIPGAFLAGVAGILIDLPMITLIALFKSPYMLFKGWNRLFHDLIGREGPFLETACVPFAGLAILLWPAAVVGAALASILSSLALGGYAAVVAYQESSIKMGMAYTFSSLSMFDEYSNDVLDLPEGSCFPRYRYRKNPSSGTSSGSTSFNQENRESKNPSRTTSFKGAMAEIKPLKVSQVALSLSHAGYESTCLPPWRTRGPALKSTKRAFIGAAAHTLQPVSKPATTRRVVEAGRARTPDLLDKKLFIELPASTTRRAVAGSSGCVWAATLMKARLVDSRTGPLVLQGGRQLLEQLFAECKLYGDNLVAEQVITVKDVKEFKSGKTGSSIISVGLPAYCILQALVRSAKENVDGLLLSDNTEIMTQNRPKDSFFDFFFDPLMIIKEQIRIENFTEEEEGYLCKLVLLLGHPDRLSLMTAASSPQNERRRAEINAIARRLQGITKSISRYPTVRRRYDELLKSFSEELERKMGGSEHRYQSGRSFLKTFSLNSLEIKAGGRGIDEEAQLTSDPTVRLN